MDDTKAHRVPGGATDREADDSPDDLSEAASRGTSKNVGTADHADVPSDGGTAGHRTVDGDTSRTVGDEPDLEAVVHAVTAPRPDPGLTTDDASGFDDRVLGSTTSADAVASGGTGTEPDPAEREPDRDSSVDSATATGAGAGATTEPSAGRGQSPPGNGPYLRGGNPPGPDGRDWGLLLHRIRVPITLTLLLLLLAGAAWYGWQALLGGETATRSQPECVTPSPGSKQEVSSTDISVNVYNAGHTSGLADRTAEALSARGFTITEVANDPEEKDVSTVRIRGRAKDAPEVALLAAQVEEAKISPDTRTEPEVDLVVGDDFESLKGDAPTTLEVATKTPICQTPGTSPTGGAAQ